MLAYSSIGHAGYILVAFLAPSSEFGGGAAIMYYLVAYTLMTMGAFGVVMAVSASLAPEDVQNEQGQAGEVVDPDDISRFNRLGFRNPVLAALMSLFMLSLAGLPPGMAGLLGKFYVFNSAIKAGYIGLAIVGVLCSAVSCGYYLRVIVAMYFLPENETARFKLETPGFSLRWALNICAIGVIVIGIFPSLVYDSASQIMARF